MLSRRFFVMASLTIVCVAPLHADDEVKEKNLTPEAKAFAKLVGSAIKDEADDWFEIVNEAKVVNVQLPGALEERRVVLLVKTKKRIAPLTLFLNSPIEVAMFDSDQVEIKPLGSSSGLYRVFTEPNEANPGQRVRLYVRLPPREVQARVKSIRLRRDE